MHQNNSHTPLDNGSIDYPNNGAEEDGESSCHSTCFSWLTFCIPDGESNQSLTSQTLNADGTPKCPMNALMIFARCRRPQVSSENQSMRTGEISKILSKEWNSMMPAASAFLSFFFSIVTHLSSSLRSSFTLTIQKNSRKHSTRNTQTMSIIDGRTIPENAEKLAREYTLWMGLGLQTRPRTKGYPEHRTMIIIPALCTQGHRDSLHHTVQIHTDASPQQDGTCI